MSVPVRLSAAALPAVLPEVSTGSSSGPSPGELRWPRYPRSQVTPGIVHLGVGNFHRAHQAVYIDDVLNAGERDWGIIGVSLKRADMRDALAPQDGLYCLLAQSQTAEGPRSDARVIGSLQQLLVAPESPVAVISAMADPRIRMVTLTITEKGYCLDSEQRGVDWKHPEIEHDLRFPDWPKTAMGLILAALRLRQLNGAPALSVLSCDNLANNGATLQRLLSELDEAQTIAKAKSQSKSQVQDRKPMQGSMSSYFQESLACPSSMVDRIVPHTTEALRAQVLARFGVQDAWPVATEPFTQWVLEDRFAGPRPRLEEVGVQFVKDVAPFEAMKLRLLNAAHSAIAYLGVPAGWNTVDQAIAQPALLGFIERLWANEIIPVLPPEVRNQAPDYARNLLARFGNAALAHQTAQIAMDGSLKVPLRWLPSVRLRLSEGRGIESLALCIAAWINFLGGKKENGELYPIQDPIASRLHDLAGSGSSRDRVCAVLSEPSVFGALGRESQLIEPTARALESLRRYGTLAVLQGSTSAAADR